MFIHLIYKNMVVLLKLINQFSVSEHGTVFHFRSVIPLTGLKKWRQKSHMH